MARAYVEIPLNGKKAAGRTAFIDVEDYELVIQHPWHVKESIRRGRVDGPYAGTIVKDDAGKYHTLRMHQLITGYPETDHGNHNGLDNRRLNLRTATSRSNAQHRRLRSDSQTGYKGVRHSGPRFPIHPYQARIVVDKKRVNLGYFASAEEAARAYDAAAREHFGEFACLNFPEEMTHA